ncbi:pentapeptide repeat-containing protein [Nocardia wallacei]|uniref:pentapeptide repeat-containing protein n=1 Tax=Nocardia wallacei TaxID=480035 RepID=UPI0024544BED|nr:pentapeptide repeat-containing protein [Nocardia wallacei]
MHGWVSAVGAKARERSAAARAHATKDGRAALARRAARIRLLPAVATAVVAGLGVAVGAYTVLRWITPTSRAEAAPIDITKVSLTVVAGVGGVVALVIAYRRQRDLEQSRFVERFGAAAAQLGATDVAVRIAGVYAMAGVADESDGLRRQQCIDVLCGYLRLPYSPELGVNHQSKLVLKHHRATTDGTRADDEEHHLEYRHNDREVRATILRVIADHLRPTAEYSWSASDFDFRTAHLEDVDLDQATFSGDVRFDNATFSGNAGFIDATFSGTVSFQGATFSGHADFTVAEFSSTARFRDALFAGDAQFSSAKFSVVTFAYATFSAVARFDDAKICNAAWFEGVTFSGPARFEGVDFGADFVSFERPRQWGPPEPVFDWSADISRKPVNIAPPEWPPPTIAQTPRESRGPANPVM